MLRLILASLALLVLVQCADDSPDIDYAAFELAQRACRQAESGVERLDDDPSRAELTVRDAIASAEGAAELVEAYHQVVYVIGVLHDLMLERDDNAAGFGRSYQEFSEVCQAVDDRELGGQTG